MVAVYVRVALIGAAIAVFALPTLDVGVIRLLTWRTEDAPLAGVILLSLAMGTALAALVGAVPHRRPTPS